MKATSIKGEKPVEGLPRTQTAPGDLENRVGPNREITEQKRAEEAPRQSRDELEQRLADCQTELARAVRLMDTMLNNIPDRVYFKDAQSQFVKCNLALAKSLGLENPNQVIGKTDFDFHPAEKAKEFFQDEQRIIQSGESIINKVEKQTLANGEIIWTSVNKAPLRNEEGKIVGLVGINRDITDYKRAELAFTQERHMFRTLMDHLPVALYVKDLDGRKVMVNKVELEYSGAKNEADILGKTDFDFYPQEVAAGFRASDQKIASTGQPSINHESNFTKPDGTVITLMGSVVPMRDANGRVTGVAGINVDITDLKKAEQALLESQMIYHSFVEQLPIPVFRKDGEGRFVMVNSQFCRLKGMKAEDFLGKKPSEVAASEPSKEGKSGQMAKYATTGEEAHELIMRTGKIIESEEEYTRADGRKQYLHVVRIPVLDSAGNVIGTQGIQFDITERKQAEEALGRERSLLRTLIDSLPDAIYAKDAASRKTMANPGDLKNLKCKTEADAIGKTDFDFFPKELAEKFQADDMKVFRGQPVINREEYFFSETGEKRWLLTSKLPLRDQHGYITGLVGIGRDITDSKHAEANLDQAHKQLLDASRRAGMAEVATSVLHNVGNVLNSVNVASTCVAESLRQSKAANLSKIAALLHEHETDLGQFITNDPKGKQLPGYLAQLAEHLAGEQADALEKLARLQKNIEYIRDIVAMQQNYAKTSGVLESLPLVDLVEDAVRMNVASIERHNIKMLREYPETSLILVEKHKVLQILVNLISNAKHACNDSENPDKQIILRVVKGNERIRISIIDNGVGIPAENMTRIFNHGFTTRKDGHGFGLHSGALAAKEMGGSLVAFSEGSGRGATFTLDLPIQGQKANL